MLFSSSMFLFLFLPFVIIGYQLTKLFNNTISICFLLFMSLAFYAWGEPKFVLVMLASILINFIFGLLVSMSENITRRLFLYFAICGNLGILFYFKYLNFTVSTINTLFNANIVVSNIILPIGISFFTFQGMSYVIDIYFKRVQVQKSPLFVAFYISFFPQLTAGPIIKYIDIESQLYKRDESFEKFSVGIKRFIFGLSKKVLIANTLGNVADQIFENPVIENSPETAWLGIICYTFQIYFDFSGYSDMAIGLGKLFGFDFLENFNYPYISKSITEFWRRWHISLSSWFRDYVYIPLGGNRTGNVYVHLLIVFLITGIWHGAGMNFIVWGIYHGFFLIVERVLKRSKAQNTTFAPLKHGMTMLIVIIGWVFFRAENLDIALKYIGIMFCIVQPENVGFTVLYYLNSQVALTLAIAVFASTPILKSKLLDRVRHWAGFELAANAATLLLFFISIVFVVSSTYNPFIYFRF